MNKLELPEGWVEASLDQLVASKSDIVDGPFGSNLKTEHYRDSGPRVVRLQNIGDGEFINEFAHIEPDHFEQLRKHSVQAGDVLVASLGEVLPRACIAPDFLGPAVVKADCIRVRPADGVDPVYIAQLLNSPGIRSAVADEIQGVGRPRINLSTVRNITVPLPPTEEQKRIVNELERRLSHVQAAVAGLRSSLRRIGAARASIEHQLFWNGTAPVSKLSRLLNDDGLANGKSVRDRPGGFPVLRLSCLKAGRIDLAEFKQGAWTRAEAEKYIVRRGDFLVSRGNGTLSLVGRGGLVGETESEVAYPDTLIRMRSDPEKLDPEYLAAVWNSQGIRRQLEAVARTTAGIYKVNQGHLLDVDIPAPSLTVQRSRVRDAQQRLSLVDAAQSEVETALAKAAVLQRSLRAAAFTGKLVQQDPADEPASALLERIESQRAANTTNKQRMNRKPKALRAQEPAA
jgi:type I restriction enzyme S subunit